MITCGLKILILIIMFFMLSLIYVSLPAAILARMWVLISVAWCIGRILIDVLNSSLFAVIESRQLIVLADKLFCDNITPLFGPVVPDVNSSFAGADRSSSLL